MMSDTATPLLKFLPALLGIAALDLDGEFCKLLTPSVKIGSIAKWNTWSLPCMSTRCP